jgi:hypothetical protein
MKKIFRFVLLTMLCIFLNSEVSAQKYRVNDVVENEFIVNKKFQIDLPYGKWIVIEKDNDFYYGLTSKVFSLARLENNKIIEVIQIGVMKTAGIYEHYVNGAIIEALFKNKYDGCYERPEYMIARFYKRGISHNCFWIGHSDVYKDVYTPDDPSTKTYNSQIRKWIKENNIELPKVALFSDHSYFSRMKDGRWYILSYMIDPSILNAPTNKYINEETSEYHRNNIDNYPKHKEIMKNWISISAQRHIEFENSLGAIERHRLNLNDLSPLQKKKSKDLSNDIINQIKKLNEFYKDGLLTKDEFEKAKKKILN